MIYVTVGTEKFPFDRLLRILDQAIEKRGISHEIFAQIGNSTYKPEFFAYEEFVAFDKMETLVRKADIVIAHAGEGTTLLCVELGKPPILFPRNPVFNEHFDDHQMQLARKMSSSGKVLVAYDEEELIYTINNFNKLASRLKPSPDYSGRRDLINYFRNLCNHPDLFPKNRGRTK